MKISVIGAGSWGTAIVSILSKKNHVNWWVRRERLTNQIAEAVHTVLKPVGVAIVMEGRHMCMQMRGVEKQNSLATTSTMLGKFRESVRTRNEFMSLYGKSELFELVDAPGCATARL